MRQPLQPEGVQGHIFFDEFLQELHDLGREGRLLDIRVDVPPSISLAIAIEGRDRGPVNPCLESLGEERPIEDGQVPGLGVIK